MKAIVCSSGNSQARLVTDHPAPQPPRGTEVLCRSLQVGICGTDREIIASAAPLLPEDSSYLILGHECLGQIEAVGDEVTRLKAGDLVLPLVRRPTTPCARPDLLEFGAFTERGIVHEHGFTSTQWLDEEAHLISVDRSLEAWAVLAEPVSVAEKGINEALLIQQARIERAGFSWTQPRVLITGLGPIAFACLIVARAHGWETWLAGRAPADSSRVDLVRAFGGHYLSSEELSGPSSESFDMLLECTGNDYVTLNASKRLGARAIGVWLGSSRLPRPRSHHVDELIRDSLLNNLVHLGSVNSARRDFDDAIRHINYWRETNSTLLDRLITRRVELDEAAWHFNNREPEGIKVVIEYHQNAS